MYAFVLERVKLYIKYNPTLELVVGLYLHCATTVCLSLFLFRACRQQVPVS